MTSWFLPIPLRSQLAEATLDGQPDENKAANCVPASLASPLSYYTGVDYYGDELKDAVYGQGYTGATDPARFMAYVTGQGVPMHEHAGSGTAATDLIISAIKQGWCVNGAIPSAWGSQDAAYVAAHNTSTHAVTWNGYDDAAGTLTAMNPEMAGVGNWHVMPVSWWASRIVYGRVFTLEGSMATPLDSYFTISSDGKTYTLKSRPGIVLSGGELALFQQVRGCIGLPVGPTVYSPALRAKYHNDPDLAYRRYERAVVVYDPNHVKDSQPGFGAFFLGHVDDPDYGIATPPPPPPPPPPTPKLLVDGQSVPGLTVTFPAHTVTIAE